MDKHLLGTDGRGTWRKDLVVVAPSLDRVFAHDHSFIKGTGSAPPSNRPHLSDGMESHHHSLLWRPPVSDWVKQHVYSVNGKLVV